LADDAELALTWQYHWRQAWRHHHWRQACMDLAVELLEFLQSGILP
jgi:hypothetical protein